MLIVLKMRVLYIYVIESGERKSVLGQMLTNHSFFDENNNVVSGTIINPKDNSGKTFLADIKNDRPSLVSYIANATNGGKYDFKSRGFSGQENITESQYHLRGMSLGGIEGVSGNNFYGSARAVGNYAAGFVASAAGLEWNEARFGFDAYESLTRWKFKQECMATQTAQRIGYSAGICNDGNGEHIKHIINRIKSWF